VTNADTKFDYLVIVIYSVTALLTMDPNVFIGPLKENTASIIDESGAIITTAAPASFTTLYVSKNRERFLAIRKGY